MLNRQAIPRLHSAGLASCEHRSAQYKKRLVKNETAHQLVMNNIPVPLISQVAKFKEKVKSPSWTVYRAHKKEQHNLLPAARFSIRLLMHYTAAGGLEHDSITDLDEKLATDIIYLSFT